MTLLRHLVRFSQVPPISEVCNNIISSITGDSGKIPSAGNAWCITNTCEIYEMKKKHAHMGQFIMHGWPDVTVGVAAHDVLLSSFLSSGKLVF